MSKYTLEEIEKIAMEKYSEWNRLIDQEPTIYKNFKDKEGKSIVIIIDEEGSAVGAKDGAIPVSLESWDGITSYYLHEYKNGELLPNENMTQFFKEETLKEIITITLEWLEIID